MDQSFEEKKFYQKKWFAVVMLFLLAPVGIFLLWKYTHFTRISRMAWSIVFGFLFLGVMFSEMDETPDAAESNEVEAEEVTDVIENEEIEEVVEVEEEMEEEIEKEELYVETNAATYDTEMDQISVEADTNFADGVQMDIGFYASNEEIAMMLTSGIVENGNLIVELTHLGEESGLDFILNGNYHIQASISTNDNAAFLEVYESYDHFLENYDLQDGMIEETDNGFVIESISLGEIEITNAYTETDYDRYLFEEDKDMYEALDYAQLNKNPNGHAGEMVYYTGEIIQIMEEEGFTVIRLAVTEDSYGYNFNDVVWVEYTGNTNFVDEDVVTVYGMVFGAHSYTSQAGWDITVPGILADWIE